MDEETVTDLPTAQSLVRLRLLTEDAARRANDTAEAGRHQALIALDGACEHALWLAARHDGVRIKENQRGSLPALHGAITHQRSHWRLGGWAGVEQMHEARNGAQHAGITPDTQQLVAWADAAVAFINSLCVAAFGTELKDIVLASAIRDEELRGMLTSAEMVLAENPRQSFAASEMALSSARWRWRSQRQAAVPAPTPTVTEPIFASTESQSIGELADALGSLNDILEIQPFAGDIGEYIWLQRVSRERASAGWGPVEDEARRALVFVTGWIVRWEIFSFGYPEERWAAHRDGVEPPTHGDGKTVSIIGAQAQLAPEAMSQPPRNLLYLQLANVPNRGRPPWDAVLHEAVTQDMRELKTGDGDPVFARCSWHESGSLFVALHIDADADAVISVIEQAVATAAQRYADYLVESDEKENRRLSLERQLRALMAEASEEPAIFGEASVVRDDWLGTLGFMAFIPVQASGPGGDPQETIYVQNAFSAQQPHLQHFHWRNNSLTFSLNEMTEGIEAAIRSAIAGADAQVARLRSFRMQQSLTHTQFARRISDHFGPFPEPQRNR